MQTDVSTFSVGTGASVTPVKRIPIRKSNMKSPTMSSPRKDPIPYQYINRLIKNQYTSLPPHLAKYYPGYKLLLDNAHDPNST